MTWHVERKSKWPQKLDQDVPRIRIHGNSSYMACRKEILCGIKDGSWGSSVSIVTDLRAGQPGFDSRQEQRFFSIFATASRPVLGPTQPPIQWVPGALSLGVKRPGREACHSPPSSAEIKNA
jgi:hypothetical protein